MTSKEFEQAQLRLDIDEIVPRRFVFAEEMTVDEKDQFNSLIQAYFERRD
jgi:hypothetical protein